LSEGGSTNKNLILLLNKYNAALNATQDKKETANLYQEFIKKTLSLKIKIPALIACIAATTVKNIDQRLMLLQEFLKEDISADDALAIYKYLLAEDPIPFMAHIDGFIKHFYRDVYYRPVVRQMIKGAFLKNPYAVLNTVKSEKTAAIILSILAADKDCKLKALMAALKQPAQNERSFLKKINKITEVKLPK